MIDKKNKLLSINEQGCWQKREALWMKFDMEKVQKGPYKCYVNKEMTDLFTVFLI